MGPENTNRASKEGSIGRNEARLINHTYHHIKQTAAYLNIHPHSFGAMFVSPDECNSNIDSFEALVYLLR